MKGMLQPWFCVMECNHIPWMFISSHVHHYFNLHTGSFTIDSLHKSYLAGRESPSAANGFMMQLNQRMLEECAVSIKSS